MDTSLAHARFIFFLCIWVENENKWKITLWVERERKRWGHRNVQCLFDYLQKRSYWCVAESWVSIESFRSEIVLWQIRFGRRLGKISASSKQISLLMSTLMRAPIKTLFTHKLLCGTADPDGFERFPSILSQRVSNVLLNICDMITCDVSCHEQRLRFWGEAL